MTPKKPAAPAATPAVQPVPAEDAALVKGGSGPRKNDRIAVNHNQTLRVR
jgi:hypothetical protein